MSARFGRTLARVLATVRSVLGGAVAWAAVGTLAAVVVPLGTPWPGAPGWVRWAVQLALGFGLGWWLGVVWTALLAGGRSKRREEGETLPPALPWLGAGATLAATLVAHIGGCTWRCSGLLAAGVAGVALLTARRLVRCR